MSVLLSLVGLHGRHLGFAIALGFMAIEWGFARLARRDNHDLRETAASLGIGVGQALIRAAEAALLAVPYGFVYGHRLFTIPVGSAGALAGLFLGTEFLYYWHHRASHRVRWLWATHSVHHSSTRLNFTAAIRLGWTGNLSGNFLFFLPLVWLGFHPFAVIGALAVNLLYQFFIHTELAPRLGPLEWVLNTPTHHRVHHASNAACLDRNYGGVLIVFDRLFGSFAAAPADEPLRYGLVGGVVSYNPLRIALGEWRRLLREAYQAEGTTARLKTLFGPPEAATPLKMETRSMSTRLKPAALLALFAIAIAAGPARAQSQPAGEAQGKGHPLAKLCRADYERLCRDVPRGGGRILACLKDHDAELSPDCRQGLAAAPAK